MKILFITHADFEKPGCIETWAKNKKYQTIEICPYKGESLIGYDDDFDLLVVMGGPQSPLATDKYPYLINEIEFIKKAIINRKRVIGICLGAQLIAEALGAKTERSPNREIGMYPIELLPDAQLDPVFMLFPNKFDVMHWHNDMPGLTKDMVLLAKSDGCPRQAYRYGDRIYGFQCHFEMTPELIKGMIKNCSEDLINGAYIRTKEELLQSDCKPMNRNMEFILNHLEQLSEAPNKCLIEETTYKK